MLSRLPVAWQDRLRRLRDATGLARQPRVACDAGPLGELDRGTLRGLLQAPCAERDWDTVEAELAALGISDRADGVNPGDRRVLYHLIRSIAPSRVLEIGTHVGASTTCIAAALRENARAGSPAGYLTTVDIVDVNDPRRGAWSRHGAPYSPVELVRRLGMDERTAFVTRPSLAFLREVRDTWDFIFLDGDHRAATVYREIPAALARLNPGGFLLLHDYFPDGKPLWPEDPVIPGVWLATDRLRAEGAALTVLPFGELPWPTKLGRSVSSLAFVVRSH